MTTEYRPGYLDTQTARIPMGRRRPRPIARRDPDPLEMSRR